MAHVAAKQASAPPEAPGRDLKPPLLQSPPEGTRRNRPSGRSLRRRCIHHPIRRRVRRNSPGRKPRESSGRKEKPPSPRNKRESSGRKKPPPLQLQQSQGLQVAGKEEEPSPPLASTEAADPAEPEDAPFLRGAEVQRQANMKQRSIFEGNPTSPIEIASSGDEHNYKHGSSTIKKSRSDTKRPRNEAQQRELVFSGEIRQTEVLLDCQHNKPTCGAGASNYAGQKTKELPSVNALKMKEHAVEDERGKTRSLQEILGKHDVVAKVSPLIVSNVAKVKPPLPRPSPEAAATARSERRRKLLHKQPSLQAASPAEPKDTPFFTGTGVQMMKEHILEDERGENILLKNFWENMTFLLRKDVVCPLAAPVEARSTLEKQRTTSDLNTKMYVTVPGRKRSRELSSPHSLLDVDRTFQHRGRKNPIKRSKYSPLQDTHQQKPVGYEPVHDVNGIYIRGNLLGEELTNDIYQENRNESVSTNHDAVHRLCYKFPFPKTSDAWLEVEASDVFKLVPQQPHFLPFQKYSPEIREGMALGVMIAFATLVKNIRQAHIENSTTFFQDKINSMKYFENHGFDVQLLRSKLTNMLKNSCNHPELFGQIKKRDTCKVSKTTYLSQKDALLHQKKEAISELKEKLAHLCQEAKQIEKDREDVNMELLGLELETIIFVEAKNEGIREFQNDLDNLHHKELPSAKALTMKVHVVERESGETRSTQELLGKHDVSVKNHAAFPFPKTLDQWPQVEASDVFKLVPQQPHFLPFQKYSPEICEGMALGVMIAFATLVKNIRQAHIANSTIFFQKKINSLKDFEEHGFDVQLLRSKLTNMLKKSCNHPELLGQIKKRDACKLSKTNYVSQKDALLHQKKEAISELKQKLAHLCQEAQQIETDREDVNMELLGLELETIIFVEVKNEVIREFQNDLDDMHHKELF